MSLPDTYLKMISTVGEDGMLRLELVERPMPDPKPGQIIVRVEATPINPSDHGVMFGWADMGKAETSGAGIGAALSAPVSPSGMKAMKARINQSLPLGNEGAGTVVAAGEGEYAQSLVGKVVAVMGGACMPNTAPWTRPWRCRSTMGIRQEMAHPVSSIR